MNFTRPNYKVNVQTNGTSSTIPRVAPNPTTRFTPPSSPIEALSDFKAPFSARKKMMADKTSEVIKELAKRRSDIPTFLPKEEAILAQKELDARIKAAGVYMAQKEMEQFEGDMDANYQAEFRDFLLGKSKYNRLVPWGRRKLVGDDIDKYLEAVFDKKAEFEKRIGYLKSSGLAPSTLEDAWIYYNFVLKNPDYTDQHMEETFLKPWENFLPAEISNYTKIPTGEEVKDSEIIPRKSGIPEVRGDPNVSNTVKETFDKLDPTPPAPVAVAPPLAPPTTVPSAGTTPAAAPPDPEPVTEPPSAPSSIPAADTTTTSVVPAPPPPNPVTQPTSTTNVVNQVPFVRKSLTAAEALQGLQTSGRTPLPDISYIRKTLKDTTDDQQVIEELEGAWDRYFEDVVSTTRELSRKKLTEEQMDKLSRFKQEMMNIAEKEIKKREEQRNQQRERDLLLNTPTRPNQHPSSGDTPALPIPKRKVEFDTPKGRVSFEASVPSSPTSSDMDISSPSGSFDWSEGEKMRPGDRTDGRSKQNDLFALEEDTTDPIMRMGLFSNVMINDTVDIQRDENFTPEEKQKSVKIYTSLTDTRIKMSQTPPGSPAFKVMERKAESIARTMMALLMAAQHRAPPQDSPKYSDRIEKYRQFSSVSAF